MTENRKKAVLKSKEFVERSSLLDSESATPIHRMVLAIVMSLMLQNAFCDYYYRGKFNFGQYCFLHAFSTFHTFLYTWIPAFLSNFAVYYAFKLWATVRINLQPKSARVKYWDYFWLSCVIFYYPVWLFVVTKFAIKMELTLVLSIAIYAELTRMLMKVHAFIRSNSPRVLNYKPHSDKEVLHPTLYQFWYFFWAPTLIYRDTYPRTNSIRWSYVAAKAAEMVLMLLWLSVIFERYFIRTFNEYGLKAVTWSEIAVITIGNALAGLTIMVSIIYTSLHVWLNFTSELCRFGDRLFYEDWWNSSGYERYYRTWNVVIHDWLYTYVYKDFYEILTPGRRVIAKYAVFLLSAVFHEYITGFSFGYLLPIIFIQFTTLGTIMTYLKLKPESVCNVGLLYSLGLGNAINGTFLAMEYFARLNCPVAESTWRDYFVPRFMTCGR